MKFNLSDYWMRWLGLGIITIVSLFFAYIDQNVLPLFVALFLYIFLAALLRKAQPQYKVFITRFGFTILLMMLSVGAFNYVVNPFGFFPSHFFEPIVLISRNNKMDLYAAYASPPKALIIGSSRSFTVDPTQIEQLWGFSAFNASVTAGTMQDYVAFLHYTSKIGDLPELLIVNLAPEIFQATDNRYINEPGARLWDYDDSSDSLYPVKVYFDRITGLLSKEQIQTSFQLLQAETSGKPLTRYYTFDANGMGHFHATYLPPEELTPDKLIENFWAQRYKQFDPAGYRFDRFLTILNLAKQHHMFVLGYIPPYYPALHDVLVGLSGFTPTVKYVTSHLDTFEKEYPFRYSNFIDAPPFSKDVGMFYDVIHPTEQASALMMQQLYEQFHGVARNP